ncbi:imidazole glycerol phosphate synthase subunit HisF [Haloplasma contractile]|uniref:Imidazole glycerol phosphate synthase subunit HisF n=1 Tax=Haloplasma contractile SSD-17B TaxID=1033810 RepID=U2FL58_9MOLU|nr:imidazole glycerol phosphate synthase subunit HisF [Haloplasma contractile]ERJ11939.1 Imidazole glycerol phosphate synthase subunit HisF protein [Haloplasma contractile SSD-17B]
MLTKRIIPCLDVLNGRVVKGKQFTNIIDVDAPEKLGKFYSDSGADELVFYDITASNEERKTSLDFVGKVAREINIPFCVGGGIRSVQDFKEILRRGADKVSVNSAAVKNPSLIRNAALRFGSQCVVLSIDAKKNENGNYDVYVKGGRENTELDAVSWAIEGVRLGAGEIVVNSIDEDGMKEGYSIDLLKRISERVSVPVIASGGAGKLEDFYSVIRDANVDGVLAASVFHFGEIKIKDLKQYLFNKGVSIRI